MPDFQESNVRPILVDDILIRILCECDIATTLVAGLTSRCLHALSVSKQVRLAHLSDLQRRGFVDLPPHQRLEDLTSRALIDLVKRIVTGPKTWAAACSSPPVVVRQIVLKRDIGTGLHGYSMSVSLQFCKPYLMPGGRFLFFLHGALECWDTAEAKLIWMYPCRWTHATIEAFATSMLDGGEAIIVLVGVRNYDEPRRNYLEVVRLDLTTYISTSMFEKIVPDTWFDDPFYGAKILGDVAIVCMPRQVNIIVILQLSKATCSYIRVSDLHDSSDITITAEHVVTVRPLKDHPEKFELSIWPTSNLFAYQDVVTDIENFTPVITTLMDAPSRTADSARAPRVLLDSHPSPLHQDCTTLWVLLGPFQQEMGMFQVYKFHISHSGLPAVTQTLSRTFGRSSLHDIRLLLSITFAGYTNLWHVSVCGILSLDGSMKDADFSNHAGLIHMSAYSGAITYATGNQVVVNYYE